MTAPTLDRMASDDDTAADISDMLTDVAPELAWSLDKEPVETSHRPWPIAVGTAGILILTAVTLAAVIGLIGWTTLRPHAQVHAPVPPTTARVRMPAPSVATDIPSPLPTPQPPSTTIPPPTPTPTVEPESEADRGFLDSMRNAGMEFLDPPGAIVAGHWVCEKLLDGYNKDAVIAAVQNGKSATLNYDQSESVVYAAITFYCPQYRSNRHSTLDNHPPPGAGPNW